LRGGRVFRPVDPTSNSSSRERALRRRRSAPAIANRAKIERREQILIAKTVKLGEYSLFL